MSSIDEAALRAAKRIEDEYAKGHPGGVTHRLSCVQVIIVDEICTLIQHGHIDCPKDCKAA
jgi:hypothetical protein